MTMTKYVAQWLARANDDIETCELLIIKSGPANTICLHSQQAAEKHLKAFLAHYGKHIRKVHDLESLINECCAINKSFDALIEDARYLTQFYEESRYPGDYPEFTLQEAKKALEAALRVKKFVLEKIGEK